MFCASSRSEDSRKKAEWYLKVSHRTWNTSENPEIDIHHVQNSQSNPPIQFFLPRDSHRARNTWVFPSNQKKSGQSLELPGFPKRCQGYLSKGNLYCVAPIQLPGAYVIRYWSVGKKCCERRPGGAGKWLEGCHEQSRCQIFWHLTQVVEGWLEQKSSHLMVCRWNVTFSFEMVICLNSKSRKDVRIVHVFSLLLKAWTMRLSCAWPCQCQFCTVLYPSMSFIH